MNFFHYGIVACFFVIIILYNNDVYSSNFVGYNENIISLKSRKISETESRRNLENLTPGYYFIRTSRDLESKAFLKKILNIDKFEYIVERHTFLVQMNEFQIKKILEQKKSSRRHIMFFEKHNYEDRTILDFSHMPDTESIDLYVHYFEGVKKSNFEDLEQLSGIAKIVKKGAKSLFITITRKHQDILNSIKKIRDVYWIEKVPVYQIMNAGVKEILLTKTSTGIPNEYHMHNIGIDGSNHLVGLADTGVDRFNCLFEDSSVDFKYNTVMNEHRKIFYYQNFSRTLGEYKVSGHGSHCAGTIAGKVNPSEEFHVSKWNGVAPGAKIFVQDVGSVASNGLVIPMDIDTDLLQKPYDLGVRIHSNSWGISITSLITCKYDCVCYFKFETVRNNVTYNSTTPIPESLCLQMFGTARCCETGNIYNTKAHGFDKFTKDHDDFVVCVANCNDGRISYYGNIGAPSTAKNVVSVGASQTTSENWVASVDWTDYSKLLTSISVLCGVTLTSIDDCCGPVGDSGSCATGYVASKCCPETIKDKMKVFHSHNPSNLAEFSGRGPTTDLRIKPTIVAPGEKVISANGNFHDVQTSHCGENSTFWNNSDTSALISKQGTSMATPATAGTLVLIRSYFVDGYFPTGSPLSKNRIPNISGMLLKAVLVNIANPLTGKVKLFTYPNSTEVWHDLSTEKVPNLFFGHGLPDLKNGLKLPSSPSDYVLGIRDRVAISQGQYVRFPRLVKIGSGPSKFQVTMTWYETEASVLAVNPVFNDLDLIVNINSTIKHYGNWGSTPDRVNTVEKVVIYNLRNHDTIDIKVHGFDVSESLKFALTFSGYGLECQDPTNRDLHRLCACQTGYIEINGKCYYDVFGIAITVSSILLVGGVGICVILGIFAIFFLICKKKLKQPQTEETTSLHELKAI